MTRTDTHRPSAINPAEYELVGWECVSTGDLIDHTPKEAE